MSVVVAVRVVVVAAVGRLNILLSTTSLSSAKCNVAPIKEP